MSFIFCVVGQSSVKVTISCRSSALPAGQPGWTAPAPTCTAKFRPAGGAAGGIHPDAEKVELLFSYGGQGIPQGGDDGGDVGL